MKRTWANHAAFGGVIALLALLASDQGCTSDPAPLLAALGSGCLINSDCEGDLVCVFRNCHQQCETSADCPLDSHSDPLRCMLGEPPVHVCQLEQEKYCGLNSDCPGDQICGPVGECRDQCQSERDCVSEQQCAAGACADANEVDTTGRIAGTDADPVAVGDPCVLNTDCCNGSPGMLDCQAGPQGQSLVCRDGACVVECFDVIDCPAFHQCQLGGVDNPPTGGNCVLASSVVYCVPGQQIACTCADQSPGVQVCDASGSGYGPCTDASNMDCSPP